MLKMAHLTVQGNVSCAWGGERRKAPAPTCCCPSVCGTAPSCCPLWSHQLGWRRRRAGKHSVLSPIESHGFLSRHCTDKTKAALKWMPGLAGCQRRAGDKGCEYKCSAGSGEPRMLCGRESASPWRQSGEERTRTGMDWEPPEPQEPQEPVP